MADGTQKLTASRSQPCGSPERSPRFVDPAAAIRARLRADEAALAVELAKHRTPGKWLPIWDSTGGDVGGIVGVANSYPGERVGGEDR